MLFFGDNDEPGEKAVQGLLGTYREEWGTIKHLDNHGKPEGWGAADAEDEYGTGTGSGATPRAGSEPWRHPRK